MEHEFVFDSAHNPMYAFLKDAPILSAANIIAALPFIKDDVDAVVKHSFSRNGGDINEIKRRTAMSLAVEYCVANHFNGKVNNETADYMNNKSYDIEVNGVRIEIKTTKKEWFMFNTKNAGLYQGNDGADLWLSLKGKADVVLVYKIDGNVIKPMLFFPVVSLESNEFAKKSRYADGWVVYPGDNDLKYFY